MRSEKAILKNGFFGRKFHSKNLKNYQIEVVGPTFLNALYKSQMNELDSRQGDMKQDFMKVHQEHTGWDEKLKNEN